MSFDFAAVTAPFRMQPGLRRLAPGAPQLTPLRPGDRAFAEKMHVLRHWPTDALVRRNGFDPQPVLRALQAHAAREHPHAWQWTLEGDALAPQLRWGLREGRWVGDGPQAIGQVIAALPEDWRVPALLCLAFAEDFAVIDGTTAHIDWIAACLPSRWSPADKVGQHFAQVHAPVADNAVLLAAGDHLARLVTGADRWERFVWTITPCPTLQMHPDHTEPWPWDDTADAQALGALAHWRTERQTFIPVPEVRQAIFTIHVESRPLAESIVTPAHAAAVRDAIASMSPAVLAYRGLSPARDRLVAWLDRRAGGVAA